jgi:hypothetical protein
MILVDWAMEAGQRYWRQTHSTHVVDAELTKKLAEPSL